MNNYSKTDNALIKKVFSLKEKECYIEGIEILLDLEKRYKNDKVIKGLLGTFYYEMKDYKNSEKFFKETTEISPHSELSSLGLYVSLFKQEKVYKALKEMLRYISTHKFELYKDAVEELKEKKKLFTESQKIVFNKIVAIYEDTIF